MPALLGVGNCNATPVSTTGTQTLNVAGGAAAPGVYYGGIFIQNGTSFTYTAYDVQGTASKQLTATQTASGAGQQILPGNMTGVRYYGTLLVVTTGTPGLANSLWE